MRSHHAIRLLRFIPIVLAVWCLSCAGLKTPYPDKNYFTIDPGQPDAAVAASSPSTQPVILIRRLQVQSPYDEPHFVSKTGPLKFETDYYDDFMAEPASLMTSDLLKWLSAGESAGSVVPNGSGARHDLILEGNITALYADLQSKETPRAVIQGRFMLIDDRNHSAVIFDKAYSTSAPSADTSAPAVAAAWGQAYHTLLHSLAEDLSRAEKPANAPVAATQP